MACHLTHNRQRWNSTSKKKRDAPREEKAHVVRSLTSGWMGTCRRAFLGINTLPALLFTFFYFFPPLPHETCATWQITISSEQIYAGLGVPASWSLSEMAEPISPDSLLSGPCLSLKVRWLSAKSFSVQRRLLCYFWRVLVGGKKKLHKIIKTQRAGRGPTERTRVAATWPSPPLHLNITHF